MPLLRRVPLIALAASLLLASPAFAQSDADKATARSLGQEGQSALDAKDYKTAEDRFRRADSLYHAPTLALGLARSLSANGKFVAAQETYNRIIREGVAPGAPGVFAKAVDDAKAEVGAVSSKIAGATITVTGPDSPKVTLDDTPVPSAALGVKRPVDPGNHVVKVTADGWESTQTKLMVALGGGAGGVLLLTAPKAESAASNAHDQPGVKPYLGLGTAGAVGRFRGIETRARGVTRDETSDQRDTHRSRRGGLRADRRARARG